MCHVQSARCCRPHWADLVQRVGEPQAAYRRRLLGLGLHFSLAHMPKVRQQVQQEQRRQQNPASRQAPGEEQRQRIRELEGAIERLRQENSCLKEGARVQAGRSAVAEQEALERVAAVQQRRQDHGVERDIECSRQDLARSRQETGLRQEQHSSVAAVRGRETGALVQHNGRLGHDRTMRELVDRSGERAMQLQQQQQQEQEGAALTGAVVDQQSAGDQAPERGTGRGGVQQQERLAGGQAVANKGRRPELERPRQGLSSKRCCAGAQQQQRDAPAQATVAAQDRGVDVLLQQSQEQSPVRLRGGSTKQLVCSPV